MFGPPRAVISSQGDDSPLKNQLLWLLGAIFQHSSSTRVAKTPMSLRSDVRDES